MARITYCKFPQIAVLPSSSQPQRNPKVHTRSTPLPIFRLHVMVSPVATSAKVHPHDCGGLQPLGSAVVRHVSKIVHGIQRLLNVDQTQPGEAGGKQRVDLGYRVASCLGTWCNLCGCSYGKSFTLVAVAFDARNRRGGRAKQVANLGRHCLAQRLCQHAIPTNWSSLPQACSGSHGTSKSVRGRDGVALQKNKLFFCASLALGRASPQPHSPS